MIVAVTLAVAMAGVAWVRPSALSTVPAAAATGLVMGTLFHLGFELSGMNGAYCRVGHACVSG